MMRSSVVVVRQLSLSHDSKGARMYVLCYQYSSATCINIEFLIFPQPDCASGISCGERITHTTPNLQRQILQNCTFKCLGIYRAKLCDVSKRKYNQLVIKKRIKKRLEIFRSLMIPKEIKLKIWKPLVMAWSDESETLLLPYQGLSPSVVQISVGLLLSLGLRTLLLKYRRMLPSKFYSVWLDVITVCLFLYFII